MSTPEIYGRREAIRRGLFMAGGLGAGLFAAARPWPASAGRSGCAVSAGTVGVDRLVAGNLDFGFRLYAALGRRAGSGNLFISPLSISLALAMSYNGARGATAQAMAGTLGVGSLTLPDLNAAASALLAGLQQRDPRVALQIADSLWVRAGVQVQPAFGQTLKAAYGAQATNLDFTSPQAPATINAWVSRQTHGLIPSIVDRIDAGAILYLINALYFKAHWTAPFDPRHTRPGPFTLAGGQQVTVPMMSDTGVYSYVKAAAYEAIALPYESGKFAMYIVLPSAPDGLRAFQAGLQAATWATLLPTMTPQHGTIILPRFTANYAAGLVPTLKALGMGLAFDPNRADLSGMVNLGGEVRAAISDVRHKAVLKVYEAGTEAAAVTSVEVTVSAVPLGTFTMRVDRPFFCAIRDEVSGTLLFMGGITDPR